MAPTPRPTKSCTSRTAPSAAADRSIVFALSLALGLALSACAGTGSPTPTPAKPGAEKAFRKAQALLDAGENVAAAAELRRAIDLSDREEFHVWYQDVAHRLPAEAAAHKAMRDYYAARPADGSSRTQFLKARLERLDRREAPARTQLEAIVARDATYYPALLELGVLWRGVGAPDKAAPWFRKAVAAEPDRAEAHQALAEIALELGDWPEAAREFRRYLFLSPNDRDAERALLSLLLYRVDGEVKEMDKLVTVLLAERPDDLTLRMDRAAVYWRQGKLDAAIEEYRGILRKDAKRFRAALNLGNLFYDRGSKREKGAARTADLRQARKAYRYFRQAGNAEDAFDWFDLKLATNVRLAAIAQELGPAGEQPVRVEELLRSN